MALQQGRCWAQGTKQGYLAGRWVSDPGLCVWRAGDVCEATDRAAPEPAQPGHVPREARARLRRAQGGCHAPQRIHGP
eukprot:163545-Rhodomonas_salina.1